MIPGILQFLNTNKKIEVPIEKKIAFKLKFIYTVFSEHTYLWNKLSDKHFYNFIFNE